jgi:sterol desaturase/sphingolipid hydroxylase (fatty acid hydroxylase superfamily)
MNQQVREEIREQLKNEAQDVANLINKSGGMSRGVGKVSGVIALMLGILCVLGVLAFHYPQYLTTPELRKSYNPEWMRHLLFACMLIAGGISLTNVILGRRRVLNFVALIFVVAAQAMGGPTVPVGNFADHTPYIGLDWFILDLLGSTMVFVLIEKMFPLYKGQPVFRFDWQTDFTHFVVNHFIVGLILLVVNVLIHRLFGWAVYAPLQQAVGGLPFFLQLAAIILVADLVQYWTHRAYHEVPFLWRFHAVHHSTKVMDWMAGSRQHIFELIFTRVGVLGALYVLGFSEGVMNVYIIIVGFQAVFNHANVSLPWGPLKYLIVTPDFHHWHHSSDKEALDKNYAAHYAFLDYIFGTAVKSDRKFPEQYGVLGDYMPHGFVKQQMFPFVFREKIAETPQTPPAPGGNT